MTRKTICSRGRLLALLLWSSQSRAQTPQPSTTESPTDGIDPSVSPSLTMSPHSPAPSGAPISPPSVLSTPFPTVQPPTMSPTTWPTASTNQPTAFQSQSPFIPSALVPTLSPTPFLPPKTSFPTSFPRDFIIICPDGYLDVTAEVTGEAAPIVLCCASGSGSFPSFVFAQCEVATVLPKGDIVLFLRTDANPQETSFSLMDIATSEMLWDVYAGTTYDGQVLQADTEYRYEIAVDASSCYLFSIQDSGNDGLTASVNGVFELYYNGDLTLLGQDFGNESVIVVGDGCFA